MGAGLGTAVVVAGLLLGVVAPVAAQAAAAAAPWAAGGWVLIEGTQARKSVDAHLELTARPTGTGPVVLGLALSLVDEAGRPRASAVYLWRVGRDADAVAVASPAGSSRVTVLPQRDGTVVLRQLVGFGGSGLDRAVLLAFVPNAVLERADVKFTAPHRVVRGDGAVALSSTTPGFVGVRGGPAGAGNLVHQAATPGAVGSGYIAGCLAVCSGSWRASDGFTGGWTTYNAGPIGLVWLGKRSFAAPKGPLSIQWTGVAATSMVDTVLTTTEAVRGAALFAAYAPVGERWRLFGNFLE